MSSPWKCLITLSMFACLIKPVHIHRYLIIKQNFPPHFFLANNLLYPIFLTHPFILDASICTNTTCFLSSKKNSWLKKQLRKFLQEVTSVWKWSSFPSACDFVSAWHALQPGWLQPPRQPASQGFNWKARHVLNYCVTLAICQRQRLFLPPFSLGLILCLYCLNSIFRRKKKSAPNFLWAQTQPWASYAKRDSKNLAEAFFESVVQGAEHPHLDSVHVFITI